MPNINSYAPSFRATNDIRHEVKQPQNTTTSTNNENKIGVKDIVLGSLAAIGVLGMADVMLFKGKGINKLTGVAKKLKSTEELEQRAKNAEELIAKTEERAKNAETRAKNAEANFTSAETKINKLEDELDKLKEEKVQKRPLHENDPNILQWFQMVYADAQDFSKTEKDYLIRRIENIAHSSHYNVISSGKIDVFERKLGYGNNVPEVFYPAIEYNKTGKVVLPGKIYMPKSMIDIPNEDIKLFSNGNCLFRQKTDNGSIVKLIDTEGNILKEIRFPKKESVK